MEKVQIQLGARTVLIDQTYVPLYERMQQLRSEVSQKQAIMSTRQVGTEDHNKGLAQLQVMHGEIQRLHRQLITKAQ